MGTLRLVGSILVLVMAAYIAVMNWGCVVVSLRNKRRGVDRHHSTVPLFSLILAAVSYLLYPSEPKWWIGIVPAVDIANWTLLVSLPWLLFLAVTSKKLADPEEARCVLSKQLKSYRLLGYAALAQSIPMLELKDFEGPSGKKYQVEVQAFWDGPEGEDVRVIGSVDEADKAALSPLSEGFIIRPDGTFVGE